MCRREKKVQNDHVTSHLNTAAPQSKCTAFKYTKKKYAM